MGEDRRGVCRRREGWCAPPPPPLFHDERRTLTTRIYDACIKLLAQDDAHEGSRSDLHDEFKTSHYVVWSDDVHDRVWFRDLHTVRAQTAPMDVNVVFGLEIWK